MLLAIVQAGIRACDAARSSTRALERGRTRSAKSGRTVFGDRGGKGRAGDGGCGGEALGDRNRRGVIVAASAVPTAAERFDVVVGGHPVPTSGERDGRTAALALADGRCRRTLLVLLSGGASALMAVPADGITLDDKRAATAQLLRAGADIHELNTVRKHLSAIKGGWLAAARGGAVPHARRSPTSSATI